MSVTNLIRKTLEEIQNLMLTQTVVGEPVSAGDHTIIPVSKVMFGFGAGGGEGKNQSKQSSVKVLVEDGVSNRLHLLS